MPDPKPDSKPKRIHASDLPNGFVAVLAGDGKEYCRDCVLLKHGDKLEDPDGTTILKSDGWYGGGQCSECSNPIPANLSW